MIKQWNKKIGMGDCSKWQLRTKEHGDRACILGAHRLLLGKTFHSETITANDWGSELLSRFMKFSHCSIIGMKVILWLLVPWTLVLLSLIGLGKHRSLPDFRWMKPYKILPSYFFTVLDHSLGTQTEHKEAQEKTSLNVSTWSLKFLQAQDLNS